MDLLIKLCKVCDTEKIACEFKKYRHVCRKCDSKLNNEAYREKFAEYYQKNKAYRAEYKRAYMILKKASQPPKKKGRPRKLILEIEIVKED